MIKAVIFDLGNVIVKVDWTKFYKKFAKYSGQTVDYVKQYHENSYCRKMFERGKISSMDFYDRFSGDLNLKMGFNEFKQNYCDIFKLNKKVAQIILELKKHYKLILLSNTDELHFRHIKDKFGIVNSFDEFVLSYEIGYRKPNPLIFIKALEKTKTFPFRCLYFDDIPEFVHVARLMGIRAFQYQNFKKLINDLESAGILIR